ncbi:MAG: hypothetical protein ACLGPL_00450, partial [Acidobacteriota bacterium]
MRITFALSHERTLRSLNHKQENIDRLTTNITTGSKLITASDDPTAWAQTMDIKQGIRELDAMTKNVEFARGWNQVTDGALSGLHDLIAKAQQTAVSAQSANGSNAKEALAQQVDSLLKEAQKLASTQYGDRYVFSGNQNPSGGPYTLDDTTGAVTYNGDTGSMQVRTGKGAAGYETVNVTGPDAFTFTSGGSTLNTL